MRYFIVLSVILSPCLCDASSLMEENWERHLGLASSSFSQLTPTPDNHQESPSSAVMTKKESDWIVTKKHHKKNSPTTIKPLNIQKDHRGSIPK